MNEELKNWKEYKEAVWKHNEPNYEKRMEIALNMRNHHIYDRMFLKATMDSLYPIIDATYEGMLDWLADDKKALGEKTYTEIFKEV